MGLKRKTATGLVTGCRIYSIDGSLDPTVIYF